MIKNVVMSQNIPNNGKLQKRSNYNDVKTHRFDVKTIKATQNSKRDQITMNLHRFDVQNDQKCWVTSQTTQNR